MAQPLRSNIFRFALPVTFVLMTVIAQGLYMPPFDSTKLLYLVRSIFFIVLTFELGRLIVKKVQQRFPGLDQTGKRIFYSYLSAMIVAFLMISLSTMVSRWISPKSFSFGYESLFNLVQSLWFGLLIAAPNEMLYAYELSVQNEMKRSEMEKLNLQSRLEALQAQMNPHFLFNTLNTLTSLIAKDPVRAENFSVEMAYVYRYMLKNIHEPLIKLREELDFSTSYIHLLKVRFGNELLVDINVNENLLEKKLPPLSIQLLVENAMKHNVISELNPLVLRIHSIDDDHIEVVNTLQEKVRDLDSPGTGLQGLQMRYELLKEEPVEINRTNDSFSVRIKLI